MLWAGGHLSRGLGEAVLVREYAEEPELTQCQRQMNELRRFESKLVLLEKKMDEVEPSARLELFRTFLVDDARMSKLREMREARSTELDLFRVLRVHDSELVHSNFLAWLLNPAETHGIQEYFLRNFLERTAKRALSLLKVDEGQSDGRVAEALSIGRRTFIKIRKRFCKEGPERALIDLRVPVKT